MATVMTFAAAALAAACVTTYEEMPLSAARTAALPAVPVSIPFPQRDVTGEHSLLFAFYDGVFERMKAAAEERDAGQLEALVAAYDRPELPERLRSAVASYGDLAAGLRFQEHAVKAGTFALVPGDAPVPPIGMSMTFRLEVPPAAVPVQLGGRSDGDPTGFSVAVTIDDSFLDGGARSCQTQDFVWLPEAVDLVAGTKLEVPVEVAVAAREAVQRVVHVRIDMMPGYATIEGRRAPLHRRSLGAYTVTQWPKGHEVIAKAPLQTLRAAIASRDPTRAAQVYLGACFVKGDERDEATRLLIEQVRFGREDEATVAIAALRGLTGENLPARDREAWLAWWQARR